MLLGCLALILLGCQHEAEKRIRAAFEKAPNVKITGEEISSHALRLIPIGTEKKVVLETLREFEEGPVEGRSNSIVGVYPIDGENGVIIRFEYGRSIRLVHEHYAVEFSFNDDDLLAEVVPHIWLTGL